MYVENITSKGVTLNSIGKSMQIEVYEKELKRLYNIINELEKESYLGMLENQNNNDYAKGLYCAYKYINNKIKELKIKRK